MAKRFVERSTVRLHVSVSVAELVDEISYMDRDNLHELIVDIDARMQDWDFTLRLADHFDKLREEWKREVAEDEAKAKP